MATMEDPQTVTEPPGLVERARGGAGRVRARMVAWWRGLAFEQARTTAERIHRTTAEAAAAREKVGVARPVTAEVRRMVRAFHREWGAPTTFRRLGAVYVVATGFVLVVNEVRDALPVLPGLVTSHVERFTTKVAHAPAFFRSGPTRRRSDVFADAAGVWVHSLVDRGGLGLLRVRGEAAPVPAGHIGPLRGHRVRVRAPRSRQQRTDGLRRHAVYMDVVRSELRRPHRVRGTLPAGDRRRAVRAHVRRVIKCLNAAEARIDVDGDHALSALVVLLGQVADRYADGRLGALLDEEKLTDYSPGQDWEPRVALLAVVFAVGAVGAGFLALSDPVTVILIIGVGVLGVALLYRKNLAKGMGLLELWRL
ncbi:hypothetical protein [Streptomyces olivochromogenes]|uniref:hypothetical protein n=1 Tax=Streptomyces olivochromogenes TaxID=1963 RepID=UPI0036916B3F